MEEQAPSAVTKLLSNDSIDDTERLRQLLPLVYDELHQIAYRRMAGERPGHTLQATALVHEAYMRLVGGSKLTMNIYTKLGVHDLAGALDRLPRLTPPRPDRDALRATGTDDAAAFGHQQYTPLCARETAQMSATAHGEDGTGTLRFDSRKSSRGAEMNDAAQTGAASGGKAIQGTRTSGLKFTQAPVN